MMKTSSLLIKLCMIASLITSIPTQANEAASDDAIKATAEAECGVGSPPLQQSATSDEVSYISGGICITGVQEMKDLAKDYVLELVLVEKTDEYEKENYIADVMVTIKDVKENLVLSASTEGPFLLVNLPDGQYKITADYTGIVKTRVVNVSSKKHNRVVILWSKETQSQ